MRCLTVLILSLILWQTASTADAGIIASFTADGSALPQTAINVGEMKDIDLYLVYDATDGGPNYLNSPGLLSAGVGISFAPTSILNTAFLSYGAGWDNALKTNTINNAAGFASIQTTVDFFDPPVTDGGTNSILLGTFRFTGVAGGSSLFTLTDADLGFDDTVVDDANVAVLDDVIEFGRTTSITVNSGAAAVPEPATGMALLLGWGLLAWRRSRKFSHHAPRDQPSSADCHQSAAIPTVKDN